MGRSARVAVALATVAAAAGCSRGWLLVDDASRPAPDAARPIDAAADAGDGGALEASAPPSCVATDEVCNGRDDDCDGRVDEELEIRRCPAGGESICIAGSYSECPRRCPVCMPGSERVCFVSFCKVWGRQVCQADGWGWGSCLEEEPPGACSGGPFGAPDEAATGRCCLSMGLCCVDRWDADGDGDTDEAMGACEATSCD